MHSKDTAHKVKLCTTMLMQISPNILQISETQFQQHTCKRLHLTHGTVEFSSDAINAHRPHDAQYLRLTATNFHIDPFTPTSVVFWPTLLWSWHCSLALPFLFYFVWHLLNTRNSRYLSSQISPTLFFGDGTHLNRKFTVQRLQN